MASDFEGNGYGYRGNKAKDRLRELYHEEVAPRFHAPRIPGLMFMLTGSLVILILLFSTLLIKYNYFIGLQEDVFAKRGHLEAVFQRRINLFENLIKLTLNHAALEHEVFSHVADVRTNIIKKLELPPEAQASILKELEGNPRPSFDDVGKALTHMNSGSIESSLGRLLGLVEQYPNIKSSETYLKLMDSLLVIEDLIAQRRMDYQESIRAFNQQIQNFPWSMLADLTGFRRFDYFHAEAEAHQRPVIHSDMFEQLLPISVKRSGGVVPGGFPTFGKPALEKIPAPTLPETQGHHPEPQASEPGKQTLDQIRKQPSYTDGDQTLLAVPDENREIWINEKPQP